LLLAVAQLPLLARVRVRALEVANENLPQVGLVLDLVAGQVLKPRTCGIAEVERQVLDHEEIVSRSPGMARKSVVLEPYAGNGVPVVSWHIGRGPEVRGILRVADAPIKGPWSTLAW
jgi:hypothetical protein